MVSRVERLIVAADDEGEKESRVHRVDLSRQWNNTDCSLACSKLPISQIVSMGSEFGVVLPVCSSVSPCINLSSPSMC